jgi:exopolysaccharide biosynthesis polyprenyl glycosylphosphotransferase
MKRSDLLFAFLFLPIDLLAILGAYVAAYFLRANVEVPPIIFLWPFDQYLPFIAAFLPAWAGVFALAGLYDIKNLRPGSGELPRLFLAVSAGTALVVLGIFLTRTTFFSRLILLYAWALTFILVRIGRVLIRYIQQSLFSKGIGVYRVLVVGNGHLAEAVIGEVEGNRALGYRVVKVISKKDVPNLDRWIARTRPDEIWVGDPTLAASQVSKILDLSEDRHIGFKQVPNLFTVKARNVDVLTIAGVPIMSFRKTPLEGWWRIGKRVFDVVISSLGIVITSPLMLGTAIAVKLGSPGPMIYKNKRVGPAGDFNVYKFRSMYTHLSVGEEYGGRKATKLEEELVKTKNVRKGGIYKIADDPRVNPVGEFIRKTSLDELPQLFNVLLGNMSLVGPRPHMPQEVKFFEKEYRRLLFVKPGITGLAQISGRSDLSTDEEVRIESYYVENWSLWLDLVILLRTPLALLRSRRVA